VSARPFVPRLADEELDLLISRSLDGDLSPEEASDLEAVLAHDPAAARRKEELASIVA
jgi:anti-sigma factor RsiW